MINCTKKNSSKDNSEISSFIEENRNSNTTKKTKTDLNEISLQGHNNLACWIINLLLDVLLCSIAENFYSLFLF